VYADALKNALRYSTAATIIREFRGCKYRVVIKNGEQKTFIPYVEEKKLK